MGSGCIYQVLFTPATLSPAEGPSGIQWIEGWVVPRTGMDDADGKNLPSTGTRTATHLPSGP
jgi:hypothetical protein